MNSPSLPSFRRFQTIRFVKQLMVATLGTTVFMTASLHGATRNKVNNTDALNLSTSWSGGVPGINDIATWTNAVTGANTTALGVDTNWRGITIIAPGGLVTINAGNILTLGNGGIDMSAATQDLVLNPTLILQGYSSQTWNVAAGRTLSIGGSITRSTGATLNVQGAGTVNASGLSNDATGIIGTWATFGASADPLNLRYATKNGTGNIVAYTGTSVAVASVANSPNSNYEVSAVGTLGANASFNTLRYSGAAGTITGAFTANGLLNAGSGALTMSGPVTIGASKELVVTNPDSTRNIVLSGIVSDNASGSSGITKTGEGGLTLSGANTYTGITSITRGSISINNASSLGSTAGGTFIFSGDNSTPTAPGGQLSISGGINVAEAISIASGSGNPLVSLVSSGANTMSGIVALSGTGVRFSSNNQTLTFTGGLIGNNSQIVFNTGGTGSYNIVAKPMNLGTGNFYYDSSGSEVVVGVAGNLWGSTQVASGTLRTTVANAFPFAATLALGQGYAPGATVNLNGNNQTIGSLVSNTFLPTGTRTITSGTPAILTIDQSANSTSDAQFTGAISIVKTGTGNLTLGGKSTTTGSITVNRGTLTNSFVIANVAAAGTNALVDNFSSASPLILGGGTFQVIGRSNATPTTLLNATWGNNSNQITVGTTANVVAGQSITGPGIPANAYVVAVIDATRLQINVNLSPAQSAANVSISTTSTNNFTSAQTFTSTTLNAGGSSVVVNANGGDGTVLNLGTITRNAGGTLAISTPQGTQSATNGVTANQTNVNGILGGWATVGNNWATNATNTAGGNIVGLSTYTDVTRLSSGNKTIVSDTTANVRIIEGTGGAASITPGAAGTTDINTLLQSATGGTVTYDPGTTDVLRVGAEGGIMLASNASALNIGASANDGILTAGGANDTAGNLHLVNNHTSNLLTINSTVADNGTGAVTLIKSGTGTVVLAGTNTYTGKTYVGGGKLSIASEAALGANPTAGTADQLTMSGGTLLTTATFAISDGNRGITLAAGGGTFETSGSTTLTLANVIAGSGPLTKTGTGTLALTNANTFTGDTIMVQNLGKLALGNVNALQASTLDTGATGSQALTFTVSGTNTYNVGGLKGTNGIALEGNTLSVGANNLSTVYAGVLSGTNGKLTKVGSGILNLTGASTHTGDTLVSGGYLGIYNTNALQASTLDTGTSGSQAVIFAPSNTTYNLGGLKGSDDLDIGGNTISVGNNNQTTTYAGAIVSPLTGGLIKVGTGTLTLTGANAYNGNTSVNAGVLQVGNSGVGSSGTGAVNIAANATLIGTGTVRGSAFTLVSNATLRAGDSVANSSHGTLTFTPDARGTFDLQAGSKTILSLSGATNQGSFDSTFGGTLGTAGFGAYIDGITGSGNHDRLAFNGTEGSTLNFLGSLTVVADNFTAAEGQVFNLLDWGSLVGTTFDSAFTTNLIRDGLADNGTLFDLPDLQSLTTGLFWDISRFTTSGTIFIVPEPSRALLLLAGCFGLLMRRRRNG